MATVDQTVEDGMYQEYLDTQGEWFDINSAKLKGIEDVSDDNFKLEKFDVDNNNGYVRGKIWLSFPTNGTSHRMRLPLVIWYKGNWYLSTPPEKLKQLAIGMSEAQICECVTMEKEYDRMKREADGDEALLEQAAEIYGAVKEKCDALEDEFKDYFENASEEEKEELMKTVMNCMDEAGYDDMEYEGSGSEEATEEAYEEVEEAVEEIEEFEQADDDDDGTDDEH